MPRATTAAWLVMPPRVVRIPLAACMPWMSSGLVSMRTRITLSPFCARASASSAENTAIPDAAPGEAGGEVSFIRARMANEVLKAQTARVRLQKMKGELVDRARAVTTVFDLARRERDAWLNWPPRVAALMAADLGVEAHAMETVLEARVRQHLAELAEVKVDLR